VESLLRNNRLVPWNRSKIMLVGQGRAGKTALANNMMGKEFMPDTKSTIGAEKFERKLTSGKIKEGEKGVVLEEYVSSPKELESMMALTASRLMNRQQVKKFAQGGNNNQLSSTNANNTFSGGVSVNFGDVNTAIFNKCLSENIAKNDTGSDLVISLYDFGGQDIFNVLHPFFMSTYGVYVVVFDMELFLSKEEEKRESCLKHLKFWMNSIVMHTYDEKSEKTAPVVIVGTRKDVISDPEDHDSVSSILEKTFYPCAAWGSLLVSKPNGLCFFPVDNVNLDVTVNHLLHVVHACLENAFFTKQEVPLVWIKLLDEIKDKHESFLALDEVIRMCEIWSTSSEDVTKLLEFLNHMGILIWINEEKLRDIVILDPIEYFVRPATTIICKHIATKDDPYRTVHCEEIHQSCRSEWPEDWLRMLEYGLISLRLARRLLFSVCTDDPHVDNILLLMERFGLVSGFLTIPSVDTDSGMKNLFLPAVAPSSSTDLYVDRKMFLDPRHYYEYSNLIGRLHAKRTACLDSFDCVAFHFTISVSSELLKHVLLSTEVVSSVGFLPNGLFERFIGRVCGTLLSGASDVSAFLKKNNFIAFKDIVKLKFMSRSVRITSLLEYNMVRFEIENGPSDGKDKESLMLIHDSFYEMIQIIIRESYKNLIVATVLPIDPQNYRDHPLLPLAELKSVTDSTLRSIDYHTEDGKQRLSVNVEVLRSSFSVWLGVPTIYPKKGEYSNKVPSPLSALFILTLFLQATAKAFTVFLSHDWGEDHGNHKKVKEIDSLLKKEGITTWIDSTNNRDNMLFSIADGIRKSHFFIVFLTANFNDKIQRGHEDKEWCFRELSFASYMLSPKNLMVVVLDEAVAGRKNWALILEFLFATDMHFDLSKGGRIEGDYREAEAWPKLLEKLRVATITEQLPEEKWQKPVEL
jgi:GTPase SAR1 family protein